MRIYFIRHGHPDYEHDCLTNIGRLQAEACAERLKDSGIQKIYASSKGRAIETAQYTAKKLGLPVVPVDFMRELEWHSKTDAPIFKGGNPWWIAEDMVLNGENLFDWNWAASSRFSDSVLGDRVNVVTEGLDSWLETLGYAREGHHYRVISDHADQTVAMFSHGGSSSAALSHLLGLPFPWALQVIRMDFTSVIIVDLDNEKGSLTFPRLTLLNDARHIERINTELFFGN